MLLLLGWRCQQRQDLAEHLDGADAAMQQHQGFAGAVNLIVYAEAIHGSVIAHAERGLVRCIHRFT
jgi:hypothetical protein